MSLTNVPGFKTQAACQAAGEQAKKMQYGTTKVIKYTCVEVER